MLDTAHEVNRRDFMNPTPCLPACATAPAIVNIPGSQGAQGAMGPQGPTGATGATGPAGLVWLGNWSSTTNYVANNAVQNGGSAWVALQPSINVTPVVGAYWSLLALGQTGAAGPQGTLTVYSAYGSGTPYAVTTSASLLNLGTTTPSVALPSAGTYLIFARMRFDAAGMSSTTQVLSTYVYDSGMSVPVPNTQRSFEIGAQTTVTQTIAEMVTPVVSYSVNAATTIQLWGFLSGALGAGSLNCIEADIVAVLIN